MDKCITVFSYLRNQQHEEKIGKDDTVVYAEDLIFKMASALLVNPIGVHLFALYHPKLNIWLCPNQKLEDLKMIDLNFQLKIRFLPYSSWELFKRDSKAFEYYFYQIRTDFINFPKKKFKDGFESEVYGIALQDELRIVIEKKIKVDENNIKRVVDEIYNYLPKNMPKPIFETFFPIKNKVENSFMDSYCKNHNVNYVKSCYINQYLESIANDHHYDETFNITYFNPKFSHPPRPKIITYQVWNQQVCIKNKNDIWEPLFSIKDLMYITVLEDTKIQISHVVGAPIDIVFENSMYLKSFVSLLSGYYRLSQRWNFDICADYFSPWIDRLRKICCHGPVNEDFTKEKLNKFCDIGSKHFPFIFQQSKVDFSTFYIVFQDRHQNITVNAELKKSPFEFTLPQYDKKTFSSYQSMFEFIRSIRTSASALIPCESDHPLNLLLCRNKNDNVKKTNKHELTVVPSDSVDKSTLVSIRTKLFCIRFGEIKNEDKVMIKEFVNSDNVGHYLREISDWIHLQDSSIVNCKGIVINPFSILFEFCQTSLQDLYNEHKMGLKPNMLIQAAYSLAKSLDYIYSKEFVHGFIRFENLYVSHFSDKSLIIKLGDPIGYLDLNSNAEKERPWLPPEYFEISSSYFHQLTSYLDVFSFGTTLWQIFNNGQRPNFYPTSSSSSLSLISIPDISKLIEQCWYHDFSKRMQPYSIFGNMSRILSSTYEMPNQYSKISNQHSDSVPHSLNTGHYNLYYNNIKTRNKEKSLFKSKLSLSNMSLNISQYSGQTDTTSLNPNEDTLSIYASHSSKDLYEIEKISGSQLNSFERIGKGNYGDVFKANLQKQYERATVAVKIIPETETKSLDHEIRIMTKLKHKNIVQIIGYCYIEKNFLPTEKGYTSDTYGKYKGLIMEFLELGSLNNYLKTKYEQNIRDLPFLKFAIDIAEGMVFLASKSIIHRDLAARNILVKSENEVKISDFGLSHIVENDIYKLQSDRPIPIKWYAPESITYNIFRTKSDVWSYGVLLWEMYSFCKTDPFDSINYADMPDYLRKGKRLAKPVNCPAPIFAIMDGCWQYDVERRPDFETVLKQLSQLHIS